MFNWKRILNAQNIEGLEDMFLQNKLKENYLSWENSKVKFFSLDDLPNIRKKQKKLIKEIKDFLKSKNLLP